MGWRLARTKQCAKCPWRRDVDPHDIPLGYSPELHKRLRCAIAEEGQFNEHAMACHLSPIGEETYCVGWLAHQCGPGNNLVMRIKMIDCENADDIELVGEQHDTFEDTLPCD